MDERGLPPIQNHLPAFAPEHRFETLFEIVDLEAVGDDAGYVEAVFQHGDHLVPGFEHLPPIDAPKAEPFVVDIAMTAPVILSTLR